LIPTYSGNSVELNGTSANRKAISQTIEHELIMTNGRYGNFAI
jgi:hypothetical protein